MDVAAPAAAAGLWPRSLPRGRVLTWGGYALLLLVAPLVLSSSLERSILTQIGIGIFSSFAAREVIVSTLAIVYGVGEDAAENDRNSLYDSLRRAKRTDGSAIFNPATCASLLVFYILAAQCLSTTAVVRRETGTWRWPIFQIVYMTGLAYIAALIVYQVVKHLTHG